MSDAHMASLERIFFEGLQQLNIEKGRRQILTL